MATGLSNKQQHYILYVWRTNPYPRSKIPQVVADSLVRRGYLVQVTVPLSPKPHYRLTHAGKRFAEYGEQT